MGILLSRCHDLYEDDDGDGECACAYKVMVMYKHQYVWAKYQNSFV